EITPEALLRNQEGIVNCVRLMYNDATKAYAREAGLRTDLDHPSWIFSELAYITQVPKEFDFENPLLPPQFHYTGPFHDGKGRTQVGVSLGAIDRRTADLCINGDDNEWPGRRFPYDCCRCSRA